MKQKKTIRRYKLFLIACGTAVVTSGARSGPIEDKEVPPKDFFQPYRDALHQFEGNNDDINQTEMVHLGMPTKTSVIVWYALAESVAADRPLKVLTLNEHGAETAIPAERVNHLFDSTHRTGRIEITQLLPGSNYQLAIEGAGLHSRKLISAGTQPGEVVPFSFLVGSCFQPWDYSDQNKTFISRETAASLRTFESRARARVDRGHGPSFYLGLGDQVYVDPGASGDARIAYLHGKHSEKMRGSLTNTPQVLRTLYRYHLGLKPMNRAFSVLPSAMMWDDHDIRDGWGSQKDEGSEGWIRYYGMAREAFLAFQASRNPSFSPRAQDENWREKGSDRKPQETPARVSNELDFTFSWGAGEFFVIDGRSARDFKQGRGISKDQLRAVETWLGRLAARSDQPLVFAFCFPVPLAGGDAIAGTQAAKLTLEGSDDARERAYVIAEERNALLKMLLDHARANPKHRLLILSGDVHYSGLQVIWNEKGDRILGYEIVSSGLAQTEFNTLGPLWLTVARPLPGATLEDHGFYAGPSFAEVFISPTSDGTVPEVRVLFYPSAEREGPFWSKLKAYSTLILKTEDVDASFAQTPESYPVNTWRFSVWTRKITASHLGEYIILDQWLGSGRATRGEVPWMPAGGW
jgi:hypothetical protein